MGGVATTPVINHPEVAIVGVNKMMVRPVWDGSQFMPRKMMNLSSSFDHRVIDGWDAAVFIQRIKTLLETPALIFVDEGETMRDDGGTRPPLSCQASPPQGGRCGVHRFANLQRSHEGRTTSCQSPPFGRCPRTEGGEIYELFPRCQISKSHEGNLLQAARHRRRPGRLCLRHPRRPARHRHGDRRGDEAGRHLPHRRLHPVQGADPCGRGVREDRRTWRPARRRSASRSPTPSIDLEATVAWKDGIVGRLTSGVAGLLKKAKVKTVMAGRNSATARPSRSRPRPALQVDPRRDGGDRHRLGAGRAAVPAVRRPVISSTEALALSEVPETAGGGRRRLYRARARHRLRQAGRQGHAWSRRCRASCRSTMPS